MRAILAPPTVSLLLITATDTLAHGGGRSSFWTGGSHRSITSHSQSTIKCLTCERDGHGRMDRTMQLSH